MARQASDPPNEHGRSTMPRAPVVQMLAIYWLDLGAIGFFVAVALGLRAFAAMAVNIMLKLKTPAPTAS